MRKKTTPKTKTEKKGPSASYSQFASTTQSGSRRMLFVGAISDQRKEVTSGTRIAMVAKSRWAVRNSPIYKQCVDEAVLVSVGDGLVVQSNARDPKVAVEHQNYFRDWAVRCDLTNRYNLGQIQAMWMSGALIDGDSFGILTNDLKTGVPKIQILESHRVGSPAAKFDPNNVDGAYLGTYGEILGWNVYTDGETRDRYVPVQSMLQVMEFERPSAVRGYPVLQSSLLSVQDQLEIYELEKAACRAASDHVMLLKKQGGVLQDDPASKFSGDYNSCEKMASQMGGKVLVVDQNEDFSQVQNNRPSPAWIGMMTAIERDIVRLLPYEYQVDPSKIGGASVRLVASKVSRWAAKWQSILIDNLDRVYDYVIADAIAKGKLPDDPDFNRKSWITPRDITVDAGREASQDRADLQMGLTTAQAILGKKGMTYDEVLEQRAVEMEKLVQKSKERNLPLWMLYQSAFNWLQQGQASSQTPDAVADNLDLPPPPEPSNP
jgi:capsid protein